MLNNKNIYDVMIIKFIVEDILMEILKLDFLIRRVFKRIVKFLDYDIEFVLRNVLRYILEEFYEMLVLEFLKELEDRGRIYGYRFRLEGNIYGRLIDEYKGKCIEVKVM